NDNSPITGTETIFAPPLGRWKGLSSSLSDTRVCPKEWPRTAFPAGPEDGCWSHLTGMGDAARPERAVDPAGVEARSRAVNDVDTPAPETLESGPEQTPLSSNALRLELVSALPPEDPLKPAPPPPVARALSPRSLLMLQRSYGNAAVAELVRRTASRPSPSGGGQGGG